MQQSERLQGKAVQSETGFISDFKRKVSQQNSQYTHAITQKAPWCTHRKMKEREASNWSHNGVNYFAFVGGEKNILSLFQHHQKRCPGSVYKRGFPLNPFAEIKRKKMWSSKSGTPVIEKYSLKSNQSQHGFSTRLCPPTGQISREKVWIWPIRLLLGNGRLHSHIDVEVRQLGPLFIKA